MLQTGMNSLVLSGLNLAIICVAKKKNLAIIKVVLKGSACMLFMLVHRREYFAYLDKIFSTNHLLSGNVKTLLKIIVRSA